MQWRLKKFNDLTLDELYGILKLRVGVFVVEQNCPYQDIDDKDQLSYHLFLEDEREIVAVLRILPENVSFDEVAIGRIIVKKSYRGQGISKIMINKALEFIINDLGKNKVKLSGQAYLTDFYRGLGFEKISDAYMEDGIKHYDFLYES